MKKVLLLFATLFALGQSAFADIFAYTYQGQTLRYSIGLNGNAGVVGYFEYLNPRGPIGSLEIPATVSYGGTIYSVTGISYEAFHNCDSLTSVTIPHSVTSIGGYAFGGCDGLTSVVFNADNCTTASQGTLYLYPFSGCANITNFTFGDNVKVIPGGLCAGLSSLASVNIPDSVTSIGNYAFYNCSGLTSVTVPNSVISIGQYAFYNCSNLASVDIGNSVAPIGAYAFANCSSLTSVNLGNSVTHIYYRAYYNCSSLTSVTIPQSVTYIDSYAFGNCSGLTTVVFNADSCTHAGGQGQNYVIESPFKNSANITNFTFGANVKVIPNYLCYGLSELTSVTIPDSVTWIGFKAFYNCSNLDSVIMLPITAPLLAYNDVFQNNSATRKFYIPCGSYNSYSSVNGYWTSFLQEPDPAYTIAVSVNNTSYGSATNTPVTCAEQTIISAIANNHYHFDHWSNGSTANPDTIILTSNLAVTAHFVPDQYTVTGVSSDTAKGSVSGSATVDYLSTVTLTATANDGYHFVQWQDGNTQNPRTITVTGDATYTAFFEATITQYTITATSTNPAMGTVTGGGTYNGGATATLTAIPNTGYHFVQWQDGNTQNPRTITVTGDATYTATFAADAAPATVTATISQIAATSAYAEIVMGQQTSYFYLIYAPQSVFTQNGLTTDEAIISYINQHYGSSDRNYSNVSGYMNDLTTNTTYQLVVVPYNSNGEVGIVCWEQFTTLNETDPATVTATISEVTATSAYAEIVMGQQTSYFYLIYAPQSVFTQNGLTTDESIISYVNQNYGSSDRNYNNVSGYMNDLTPNTTYMLVVVPYNSNDEVGTITRKQFTTLNNNGIEDVGEEEYAISSQGGRLTVSGAEGNMVNVYSLDGRCIYSASAKGTTVIDIPASGTYLVKIGHHTARKVVVIR